jgi:hypothetical protein
VLCRTGLVWKSTLDDQVLSFRLIGVNNQNFIMEDVQTGTWWQQVTGEAITGPLAGRRLEPMFFEQVTWAVWSRENPGGTVLESRPEFAEVYWPELEREENRSGEMIMRFPTEADPDDDLGRGELLYALRSGDHAEKAYPMRLLRAQSPVSDRFAGLDVLIVVGADGRSVRAFDREVDGRTLEFFQRVAPGVETTTTDAEVGVEEEVEEETLRAPVVLIDADTGSEWNFSGLATSGPLAGTRLKLLQIYGDYWFDWKRFNPDGTVFAAGVF